MNHWSKAEAPVYSHCSALPYNLCILFIFAFAVPPFAKHDRGVYIGWREGVGLVEQRDHTEQDRPDGRESTATCTHSQISDCIGTVKKKMFTLPPPCGSITRYLHSAQVPKHGLSSFPQWCESCWRAKFSSYSTELHFQCVPLFFI